MALLFALVYPGFYRHQGLWLAFLIALYWIAVDAAPPMSPGRERPLSLRLGLNAALPLFLASQICLSVVELPQQFNRPFSESQALAELLRRTPALRDAILMAEPDYDVEALP